MDLMADISPPLIELSNAFRIKRHMNTYSVIVVGRNVSVQREPSGHNLKHPTKWCPPNK